MRINIALIRLVFMRCIQINQVVFRTILLIDTKLISFTTTTFFFYGNLSDFDIMGVLLIFH